MTDPTQVLLFAVVIVLTTLLVVIGWQIFQILGEIRKMLGKMNDMMDDASVAAHSLSDSVQQLTSVTEGMKSAFSFLRLFQKREKRKETHDE